jgi:translation initiation factor 2 beta subunit (eIF-2beta)/eIF-5
MLNVWLIQIYKYKITNAVKFLLNPKISSLAIEKKVEFLINKGLSSSEISKSIKRSNDNDQVGVIWI